MRYLATAVAISYFSAAMPVFADTPGSEVFVEAQLSSLDHQTDCGVFLVGSPATYKVISGPPELVGKEIHVLVDCAEIPRGSASTDRGDLKKFEVGATHFLALTKDNVGRIEFPNSLPLEGVWFYLRAASLHELRPNTSLERTREK